MRDLDLLHSQLRRQFPRMQITILHDVALDVTTVRIDPPGLPPEVYYRAAKEDEHRGLLAAVRG